ncbi:MAG: Ig-like domain-containing protein, partial [Paludibacteraceae bacterium]|nr:Ig-like domain-containing protein [Paludibacteraceae bacterium]
MKKHLLQALFVFIFGVATLPHAFAAITWDGIDGNYFYAGGQYTFSVAGDALPSVIVSEGDAECSQTGTEGVTATYALRINAAATGSVVLHADDGTMTEDKTISLSACDVVSYGAPFFEYHQTATGKDSVAAIGGSVKYISIVDGFNNNGEYFYKINGDYQANNNQLHIYLNEPLRVNDRIAIRSSNASSVISQTYKIYSGNSYVALEGSVDKNQIIDIEYIVKEGDLFIGKSEFIISRAHSNIRFNQVTISHSALVPILTWSNSLKANTTLEKMPGDALNYTASLSGSPSMGTISYSSDNTSVAIVDATTGEVSVVGIGTAKITATLSKSGCFESVSTSYNIHVAATEIIAETAAKFQYDDHFNATWNYQLSSGQYLQDMVTPLFVTATAATGYQWEKSANGINWSNIDGATSNTYTPIIPSLTSEGETNTTYYRCKVTGSSGSVYSKLDTVYVEKAEGCYPNVILDAVATSTKTVSASGTIGGIGECKLEGSQSYDGKTGYKMGDDNHHMSATLKDGYTFRGGDIVQVFVAKVMDYGNATLHIYSDAGNNWIGSIDGIQEGWNEWYITDAIANSISNFNTICLYRHGAANDEVATNQNHYIAEIRIVRLEDCYNCATQVPTITLQNQLQTGVDYSIAGTLEGAVSGIWTEKSDNSHFGDVHSPNTTIRFDSAGVYTITWTIAHQPSSNRWGCRAQAEKTVTVTQEPVIEEECPTITCQWPNLIYSLNAVPWDFDMSVSGADTTGFKCHWYIGDELLDADSLNFHPYTDVLGLSYYKVFATTDKCPSGVWSNEIQVNIIDCTLDGPFEMTVPTNFEIGDTIQLKATHTYTYSLGSGGQKQFTWYRNGNPIATNEHDTILVNQDEPSSTLVIRNATAADLGSYQCIMADGSNCSLTCSGELSKCTTYGDTTAFSCKPFTWHGTTYSNPGDYTWSTTSIGGCDSIVTLHLSTGLPTKEDTTAYVCKNSTFSWHGHNPAKEGDTWTTTNVAGCDSVVTLHIVALDTMM